MVTIGRQLDRRDTLATVVARLGNVPLDRIQAVPSPGTATGQDLLTLTERDQTQRYELVDAHLIQKPGMSYLEDILVTQLALAMGIYLERQPLGKLMSSQAMYRLAEGIVRLPDLSFCSNATLQKYFPSGRITRVPMAEFAPDLAIEIVSASNTPAEMNRKRDDYFSAGVQSVWIVFPDRKRVEIHSLPGELRTLEEGDTLTDETLVPGFSLSIRDWFEKAEVIEQ